MIPVEKIYSIRSALNVEFTKQSNTYYPVTKQSTGGPFLYYFNRWGPFFIISTGKAPSIFIFSMGGPLIYYFNGWAPSLIFQQMGPILYHFNGCAFFIISTGAWSPFFIISTGGALLYYFKGCIGPCLFVLTFRWLLIVINFRSNYNQIVNFQV